MTISGSRRGPHYLWSTATIQHQSKAYIFKNPAVVNCDTHGCTTELAGWWLLTDVSLICASVSHSVKQVTEPSTGLVRFQTCEIGRKGRQNQCACVAKGVQVLSSSIILWASKEKPTWCHLFYYIFNTHSMLNMFRPLIRPSSGVCD